MKRAVYTRFDTDLGRCGIVWKQRERGDSVVVGFQLSEASDHLAAARIERKWKAARAEEIPAAIRDVIGRVKCHFSGDTQDFCDIALEFGGVGDRELLNEWAVNKGDSGIREYWEEKNQVSIDGKPTHIVERNT